MNSVAICGGLNDWTIMALANIPNSCHLFSDELRKDFQFAGIATLDSTYLLCPVPLFSLVVYFKLSLLYTSNTISTL